MKVRQADIKQLSGVDQLYYTREYWRAKLRSINRRFVGYRLDTKDSDLTFALAERNFVQGNLERIERQLLLARVSSSATNERVGIGNDVHIQRGNDVHAIMIIPAADADPNIEYVSEKSPLGKALIGKHVGGRVEIKTALGKQNYGILRIE